MTPPPTSFRKPSTKHLPSEHDTITFGIQDGGSSGDTKDESLFEMRVLLSKHCKGPYCSEVDEFAYLVRLDGTFAQWNFEGWECLRRSRVGRYIKIDLGIPIRRWKRVPDQQFRQYVMDIVLAGAYAWIERLGRDKARMDGSALLRDLDRVRAAYLKAK